MLSQGRKTQMVPCFGTVRFLTWLWIACALLTLIAAHRTFFPFRFGKREAPRSAAFIVSGGRYGRSGAEEKTAKSLPKLVEIVPRVDRFFLGSRYGKRVPLQYQSASTMNHFSAVLDYMDRENENEYERDNI